MTLDITKLRALAEAALGDSEPTWTYVDGPLMCDVYVQTRPENPGRSQLRLDPSALGPFIAAASPGTIIELIDSIESARRESAKLKIELTSALTLARIESAKLKIELTLVTHARDAACEIIDEATDDGDWRKAHIAGLRKIGAP